MHGLGRVYMEPKGHIVLERYAGRVGGHALVHRGAGGGRLQVGLDPRGQRALRAARGLLHPHLHAPRDGLPARDLRRLAPHADAHRLVGRRLGEVARPPGLAGARDRRRRQRRPRQPADLRRGLPVARGPRLEPLPGEPRPLRGPGAAAAAGPRDRRLDRPGAGRARRGRGRHGHARARAGSSTTRGSRPARTSPRSAPTSRASRSSTRASCSAPASSSTTSASAARTARSTSRCARGDHARTTSPARSAR